MKENGTSAAVTRPPVLYKIVLCASAAFLGYWFRYYCTSQPLAAWDLPGHIAIVDRLRQQLLHGNLIFYDREWFTGWPAFQFYAFLPHLVVAILSWPLELFASDPARLSVHLSLIWGSMLVPLCLYYAAVPLAEELLGEGFKKSEAAKLLLALSVSTISFWFINHDEQWYGIGAAAPMHIGLFSQLFGWHFFFIHLGLLFRFMRSEGREYERSLALGFAALWLTHTLTALYSLFLVLCVFLWGPGKRWRVIRPHLMGLALTGFWTVPFVVLSSTYTGLDIHRPQGDVLQFLFRYPFIGLLHTVQSWLHGAVGALNVGDLLIGLLIVLALVGVRVKAQRLWSMFFLFALLSIAVFSSGFVASSLPIGIHYYRFEAYIVLLVMLLLSVVPLASFAVREKTKAVEGLVLPTLFGGLLIAAFVSTAFFPHYERQKVIDSKAPNYFANEDLLLNFFAKEPNVGRVVFEYFTDDKLYPWLTPHYLESELFRRTGAESISGLFIQSSISYRMPIASFNLLGAPTYNIPLLFTDRASLDDATKLHQLVEFGVTHLVAGKPMVVNRLKGLIPVPPTQIGPYAIFRIGDRQPPVAAALKQVVGVYDLRGNMPFSFFEYYCYARKLISSRFDFLSLSPGMTLPSEVKSIIVNGAALEMQDAEVIKSLGIKSERPISIVRLNFTNPYTINHYSVQYQHNIELDNYNDLERYLETVVRLPSVLQSLPEEAAVPQSDAANLEWANADQEIKVRELTPSKLYRINNSYFPYWRSNDGQVYRGSEERIFFVPKGNSAVLSFSKLCNPLCLIGWIVTGAGFFFFWRATQ